MKDGPKSQAQLGKFALPYPDDLMRLRNSGKFRQNHFHRQDAKFAKKNEQSMFKTFLVFGLTPFFKGLLGELGVLAVKKLNWVLNHG
ncbi:MAG TPA: hypothetical protein VJ873_09065 [bacterium]|nr:hypothetical protein [bacterium]